jgi:hypothetical protein
LPAVVWLLTSGKLTEFSGAGVTVKLSQAASQNTESLIKSSSVSDVSIDTAKLDNLPPVLKLVAESKSLKMLAPPSGDYWDLWVDTSETTAKQEIITYFEKKRPFSNIGASVSIGFSIFGHGSEIKYDLKPRFIIFANHYKQIISYIHPESLWQEETGGSQNAPVASWQIVKTIKDGNFKALKDLPYSLPLLTNSDSNIMAIRKMQKANANDLLVVDNRNRYQGSANREDVISALIFALYPTEKNNQ